MESAANVADSSEQPSYRCDASVTRPGRSLRKTLVWLQVSALAILALCSGLVSYWDAITEANELFVAKLAHSARVLEAVADREKLAHGRERPIEVAVWRSNLQGEGDDLVTADGHAYETKLNFQVWGADGRLLLRSSNAHDLPMAPLEPGFADVTIDGAMWRTFTLRQSDGVWFQTGEDRAIRGELAEGIALSALLPWLLAVPIMALVVWVVVGMGCRTLERVTEQVAHRDPRRLAPVSADQAPAEISGLVKELNQLLFKLDATLERERRFTADAAHELRTPLAALKVHAQNLHGARSADETARSLGGLLSGVDRSQRLIDQLLQMARLDPDADNLSGDMSRVDLGECIAQQMADLAPFADQRGVSLHLRRLHGGSRLRANEDVLATLFRNLIDNAIRYGPERGEVEVRIAASDGRLEVSVQDQGPGIAEEDQERVFQRFYRGLGSGQSGSGLGLSIAAKAAERIGAEIGFSRPKGGGFQVKVRFPAAPAGA